MDGVTFLGTGGARMMMARQLLSTGGLWLRLGTTQICLDPGPGAIVHAHRKGLDPTRLSGIVISHRHLDHCSDANAMIEAMTEGGTHPRGALFAPADALDDDPVILRYLRPFLRSVVHLTPNRRYRVGSVEFETSMPHQHGAFLTLGFRFFTDEGVLAYLPDTRYFPELSGFYRSDVLIMSVLLMEPRSKAAHLSITDARVILAELKPRVAIITHYGSSLWKERPWEIAARLSADIGIKVIAARDGMDYILGADN